MNHTSFNWKRLLVLSQLVMAPLVGCDGTEVSPQPMPSAMPDERTLMEDVKYLDKLYEQTPVVGPTQAIRLDLSNERVYQAVVNRRLAMGKTRENSPEVFQRLEQARKQALEKAGQVSAQALPWDQLIPSCGYFITLNEQDRTDGRTYWTAKTMLNCKPHVAYASSTLTVRESDLTETAITTINSVNEQLNRGDDGKTFIALQSNTLTHSLPTSTQNRLVLFDGDLEIDNNGSYELYYVRTKTTTMGTPPSITVAHPTNVLTGSTGEFRTCLERGNYTGTHLDCDYSTVYRDSTGVYRMYKSGTTPVGIAAARNGMTTWTADPALVWLPPSNYTYDTRNLYHALRGRFNAGQVGTTACQIVDFDANLTNAAIILTEVGGTCVAGKSVGTTVATMNLYTALKAGVNLTNLNISDFNTLANYGPDCLKNLQNVKLLLTVAAKAKCDSTSNLYMRYRTIEVQPLDFKNSCFGEGTLVTLANGKKVRIEKVKLGDKVVANTEGLVLTVTTLARGGESQPMIRLKDDKGHEVLVTEKHPVVLASGKVVTADSLKLKDQVKTDKGMATLTSIGRELYNRDVYNVALGTDEELLKAGKSNRTLFAGGFLMGDSEMQAELERQQSAQASLNKPAKAAR